MTTDEDWVVNSIIEEPEEVPGDGTSVLSSIILGISILIIIFCVVLLATL